MAVPYQQQALLRKVVYTGLIVALFTVSLLHRRLVVEPQGNALLLREVSKGEVKLTDSAVRLALTGSRGIAVTFLWNSAIEMQKKHEWNELDLLVSTITRLQPHFITPWLFQSWNLSFNVAVECDMPRDKYFYISRGLEVLAEGERRNFKPPAPGNPDMREYLAFFYQLKIGNSDEKNTMRCLLEMSCIDPLERAPDRLWTDSDRGKKVKLAAFKDFCLRYPRLVRRLNEQLRMAAPEDIVRFLDENKDIPSRFEPPAGGPQQKESVLKAELEQFPIMPPGFVNGRSRELSANELVDVFFVSRTWFDYAQEPLPDPNPDPSAPVEPPNPLVKRLPRYIATPIFRGKPARAQAYVAENLEAEGWFDSDGWPIRQWFDKERGPNDPELRAGTESKYQAGPAWDAAYRMFLSYGQRNGIYMTPTEMDEYNRIAAGYRDKFKVKEGYRGPKVFAESRKWEDYLRGNVPMPAMTPEEKEKFEVWKGYRANERLAIAALDASLTNLYDYVAESDAERKVEAVTARKYLYEAERLRRAENEDPERAIPLYEKAFRLWTQLLLAHPRYARISKIQEDLYEAQIRYNYYVQKHRPEVFKPLTMAMAQLAVWPHAPVDDFLSSSQKLKILPIRNQRGVLDSLLYYDGPGAKEMKWALAAWLQASGQGVRFIVPAQVDMQLTMPLERNVTAPENWRTFVDLDAAMRVRDRLGLTRAERAEKKEKSKATAGE